MSNRETHSDSLPFLPQKPSDLSKLAHFGERRLKTDSVGNTIVYLPLIGVYKIKNIDTGAVLMIGREAIALRKKSTASGKSFMTLIESELDELVGNRNRPTPLDPSRIEGRRIHQMADYLTQAFDIPLVLKEIDDSYSGNTDDVYRLDEQFLRMRTLQKIAKTQLSEDEQELLRFCTVFGCYFHKSPLDGSVRQWIIMEKVSGSELYDRQYYAHTVKDASLIEMLGLEGNRRHSWSLLSHKLAIRGLPVIDFNARNLLERHEEGKKIYTVIDQ